MSTDNPILSQTMEVRLWLEAHLKEDLTNKDILILLNQTFPFIKNIKEIDIAKYRKVVVPKYQQMIIEKQSKRLQASTKIESEVEKEILDQVKQVEETGYEFTKSNSEKVDILKSHRFLLAETWNNYTTVRETDNDKAKKEYTDQLLKILAEIKELESLEKSLLSALGSVREAEQKMTVQQYLDHIEGFDLLRCTEKCKSKEEAINALSEIQKFIEAFKIVVVEASDSAEATRIMLQRLYTTKKSTIKEEDRK